MGLKITDGQVEMFLVGSVHLRHLLPAALVLLVEHQ